MSNSSGLLAKDVFELFPSLDRLDFSTNCDLYGRWLGSVLAPDPWRLNESALGTMALSIGLLWSALPENFTNTTEGAWVKVTPQAVRIGKMADWWAMQMFGTEVIINGLNQVTPNEDFIKRAAIDPIEKCPKEFCKAHAYKGSGDTAGIGVCRPLLPLLNAD